MPEIGETLREARMRRRIDMTDVEAATKIRAKYLRALESEEWELLPGPTFVKTFLRTYAEYLELDARLLVEEYKQRYERPAGMDITPLNLRQQRRRRRVAPRLGPGVVVVLGVVVLLAALYALGRLGDDNNNTPTPPPNTEATATPAKKKKKAAGGDQKRQAQGNRPINVRIAATGTVYVCMEDARGRTVIDKRTLAAGETTRTYRSKRFRVTFGTAAARMRVNGRDYRVASSKDPVGYELRSGSRPRRLTSGLATCT
jgi:cytoskeleton protein RodZ